MNAWVRAALGLGALAFVSGTFVVFIYADDLTKTLFGESLTYYLSPTQMIEKGPGGRAILGGMVEPGGLKPGWEKRLPVEFVVTDFNNSVRVSSTAAPPEMFEEGIGVVLHGEYTERGVFEADRVLVKHSNEYEVAGEGQHPGSATLTDSPGL